MTYDRLALSHHLKDVSQQLASSPKPLIARGKTYYTNFKNCWVHLSFEYTNYHIGMILGRKSKFVHLIMYI